MLPNDRKQAEAQIKLTTRHILERRKLIPNTYQVLVESAKDVELDFNLFE